MRFYLLPVDTASLLADLKTRVSVRFLEPKTQRPFASEIDLALPGAEHSLQHVLRVYLLPPAELMPSLRLHSVNEHWLIDIASEVIELDLCRTDGLQLQQGRMYYQQDRLDGYSIVPKSPEFVRWAEKMFSTSKRLLSRSAELEAYVGKHAEVWRRGGGRYVQSWEQTFNQHGSSEAQ